MSFASAINTVLQGNAPLNALVTDSNGNVNIYSYNLPDNFPISLPSIVFTYKKEDGTHTLQERNILEEFVLYVVCLAPNSVTTETIGAAVRDLLDSYEDANLLDLIYDDEMNGLDPEKERYYKSLQYKVTYKS
mgnify:CR=1 FL=1